MWYSILMTLQLLGVNRILCIVFQIKKFKIQNSNILLERVHKRRDPIHTIEHKTYI